MSSASLRSAGAARLGTPDRETCLSWLRKQGWRIYFRGPSRIVVTMGETAIGFLSAQQAYRRLGGPL